MFREAGSADKQAVLSMRTNAYKGIDYLPYYYDYFVADQNRKCIIGEIKATPVYHFVVAKQLNTR
ncbi:hypothetical protein DPMN_070219 [Dreissena polymorpha]|uniref:Uncharacterized protein n=1 Tax=Dreissena polymorpha TaxID=45954 RepID=A0A9D3Z4P3_DREPO|nr:hypothetical protein DPMN_070219 [Dreissena polymorpha]